MGKHEQKRNERERRRLYQLRECGSCRACCTIMHIDSGDLQKPAHVRCPHLVDPPAKACSIYPSRPEACRDWACVWRSGSDVVPPDARPDRSGVMLASFRTAGHDEEGGVTKSTDANHAILAYETEHDGFLKGSSLLRQIGTRWVVVLMYPDGARESFGPPEAHQRFLELPSEMRP